MKTMRVSSPLMVAIAPIALLAVACDPSSKLAGPQENIDRHRALWVASGITDYQFDFKRTCLCAGIEPVTIEVVQELITSIASRDTGEALPMDAFELYPTIDELFNVIQGAIDANAFSFSASFDQTLGYPIRVTIDPAEFVVDDEVTFDISSLNPL